MQPTQHAHQATDFRARVVRAGLAALRRRSHRRVVRSARDHAAFNEGLALAALAHLRHGPTARAALAPDAPRLVVDGAAVYADALAALDARQRSALARDVADLLRERRRALLCVDIDPDQTPPPVAPEVLALLDFEDCTAWAAADIAGLASQGFALDEVAEARRTREAQIEDLVGDLLGAPTRPRLRLVDSEPPPGPGSGVGDGRRSGEADGLTSAAYEEILATGQGLAVDLLRRHAWHINGARGRGATVAVSRVGDERAAATVMASHLRSMGFLDAAPGNLIIGDESWSDSVSGTGVLALVDFDSDYDQISRHLAGEETHDGCDGHDPADGDGVVDADLVAHVAVTARRAEGRVPAVFIGPVGSGAAGVFSRAAVTLAEREGVGLFSFDSTGALGPVGAVARAMAAGCSTPLPMPWPDGSGRRLEPAPALEGPAAA